MIRMPLRTWCDSERSGGGSVVATVCSYQKEGTVSRATYTTGAKPER